MSQLQATQRIPKTKSCRKASAKRAVSAERVQEMLREIAFMLHATRVVRQRMSPTSTENSTGVV